MRKTIRQIVGVTLLLVYAFFFASTNLFYHSHQLADSKVVHSHPFSDKSHSHASSQILVLEALTANICKDSETVTVSDITETVSVTIMTVCSIFADKSFWHTCSSLRAPPALCI